MKRSKSIKLNRAIGTDKLTLNILKKLSRAIKKHKSIQPGTPPGPVVWLTKKEIDSFNENGYIKLADGSIIRKCNE